MTTVLITLYQAVAAKTKELADAAKLGVLRSLAGESGLDVNLTAGKEPQQVRDLILDHLFGTHEPPETPGLAERLSSPASIPQRLLANLPQSQAMAPEAQQEQMTMQQNPNMPPGGMQNPAAMQNPQGMAGGVVPPPPNFGNTAPQGQAQGFGTPPAQGFPPPPAITANAGMAAPVGATPNYVQPNQQQYVQPTQFQNAVQGMQANVQPGLPANQGYNQGPPAPPAGMPASPPPANMGVGAPAPMSFGPPAAAGQQPESLQSVMQELQAIKAMLNGQVERQERFSGGMNILAERLMEVHAMCFYYMVRGVPPTWPAQLGQMAQPFNMNNYLMYFPTMDEHGNMNGPLTQEQVQQLLANQQRQG